MQLELGDLNQVEQTLQIQGKRNKARLVPVAAGVAGALGDWLAVRGEETGLLFVGTGNRNRGNELTTQALYKMLLTRTAVAGVPLLSPHDFWRTDLLDAGADIVTVQKLAGHANVETTVSGTTGVESEPSKKQWACCMCRIGNGS